MGKIEERPGKVSFGQAWKDYFRGYVDFKGRTTRAGYWWVFLFMVIVSFVFLLILTIPFVKTIMTSGENPSQEAIANAAMGVIVPMILASIFSLATILPTITLMVRRVRDVGIRGRGQLVFIGIYIILSIIFPPDVSGIINGDPNASLSPSAVGTIWGLALFILSVLPTGILATTQESGVMAFFFKNKKFYQDSEL